MDSPFELPSSWPLEARELKSFLAAGGVSVTPFQPRTQKEVFFEGSFYVFFFPAWNLGMPRL